MKRLLLSAGLFSLIAGTFAQDGTFSLSGQYRPRLEIRDGFKRPIRGNEEPAAFVEQRTRLTAGYKAEKYAFKMSVQDIRIWGETGQINKSDQLLSAHEAYGEYYASPKSTIRIGRQELSYDGDRLIGTLGWAAQARAFDALKYIYQDTTGNEFHAMFSWNQSGFSESAPEPAKLVGNTYATGGGGNASRIFNLTLPKAQQMLWYKRAFSSGDVSFMALNDILESTTTQQSVSRYTLGLTPNFKFGSMKVGGQFYYTGGKVYLGTNTSPTGVSAYMFNIYAQATKVPGKPLIGVDYISGEDKEDTETLNGWTPLYGTNHKWNGFMDYFYVGNGHGIGGAGAGGGHANSGLIDIYAKTAFKIGGKSKLVSHLHYFMSPVDIPDPADTDQTLSPGLGTELDLVYVNNLTKGVTLKIGYSAMLATETMEAIKYNATGDASGVEKTINNWGWIMIDFTPNFL